MMDLGALVCTARDPACDRCWFSEGCKWSGELWPTPDPWRARKQSTFAGSDRQGRGRLVAALRERPVSVTEVPSVMGWPDDPARAERVAAQLVDEGMVEVVRRTADDTVRQAVMRLTMSS
jgi:A/G-specific adenine glycosylase